MGILERHAECCSMIGKFDGERIGSGASTYASHLMEGLRLAFGSGGVSLSDLTKICAPSRPTMTKKGFRSGSSQSNFFTNGLRDFRIAGRSPSDGRDCDRV